MTSSTSTEVAASPSADQVSSAVAAQSAVELEDECVDYAPQTGELAVEHARCHERSSAARATAVARRASRTGSWSRSSSRALSSRWVEAKRACNASTIA